MWHVIDTETTRVVASFLSFAHAYVECNSLNAIALESDGYARYEVYCSDE